MNLVDKKILVTGGSGFFGRHIVDCLIARGVPEGNIFAPRMKEFDLRRKEDCESAVKSIDVVIHLAGITGNAEFHKNHPAEVFYDNLMMGVELMDAARRAGVQKFITIGSVTEYPEKARLPFHEEDLWIGAVEPIHAPYTVAKKMLLVEAQAYRKQYGFNAVHILLTNMYGPGEHSDGGPVPEMICKIGEAKKAGKDFIEGWGTGKPTRDFLYVKDAAEGVLLVAEKYDDPRPINLGSGFEVSMKEIGATIAELMDFRGEIRWDAAKPDGQTRRVLDAGRIERELGFRATTDFKTGLKETIKYHGY
ncbi:MAG: NAD-dependent epimerase/dehydratase family protein [Candidatus Liptonbacteria bacterium]|nr:NAD-dependent epimerase/dehydratase family protein [Parcubacteria group bacterium]MBI4087317.1 NAD-dependent epimerase/dehydratase family protein [Candidatus Liptonbacteria bacterium]